MVLRIMTLILGSLSSDILQSNATFLGSSQMFSILPSAKICHSETYRKQPYWRHQAASRLASSALWNANGFVRCLSI